MSSKMGAVLLFWAHFSIITALERHITLISVPKSVFNWSATIIIELDYNINPVFSYILHKLCKTNP